VRPKIAAAPSARSKSEIQKPVRDAALADYAKTRRENLAFPRGTLKYDPACGNLARRRAEGLNELTG
jgi:hypothetical protein